MHKVQCKCGSIRGQIEGTGTSSRVICYCTDCRAFAHFLGKDADVLDAQGGTEIVQVAQPRLRISQGAEHLSCVRLSPNGMLRWYAACCNTPLGNTMADPKIGFIGMIHSSLDQSRMDEDFGKAIARLNTSAALGEKKPVQNGLFGVIARFIWLVFSTRFSGRYKNSELFNSAGMPIAQAKILTSEELTILKNA
ncbi:MAG: DUF6151 family protein [Pseudomonadota bacterium]